VKVKEIKAKTILRKHKKIDSYIGAASIIAHIVMEDQKNTT